MKRNSIGKCLPESKAAAEQQKNTAKVPEVERNINILQMCMEFGSLLKFKY